MTDYSSASETESYVTPEHTHSTGEYAGQKYRDPWNDSPGYPSANTLDAAVTVT